MAVVPVLKLELYGFDSLSSTKVRLRVILQRSNARGAYQRELTVPSILMSVARHKTA